MPKPLRKEILTHRRDQFVFAARCAALVVGSHLASTLVYWFFLTRSVNAVADQYGFNPEVIADLMDARRSTMMASMFWVLPANVVVSIWFGLRFSHRFYGVLVPVKRLIEELGDGKFGRQITFRKRDEMTDLRDAINTLSARLAARDAAAGGER